MKQYIGCDAHTRYSVFVSVDETGKVSKPVRVDHGGRDLRDYLAQLGKDTPRGSRSQRRLVLVHG